MSRRLLLIAVLILVLSERAATAVEPRADAEPRIESAFNSAVTSYQRGRLDDAIEQMRAVVDGSPDDADALWNLGLWTAEAGRLSEALDIWLRYRDVSPHDWRGRAKLIQAYQALGRETERDREIEALREARSSGVDNDLVHARSYCRDQFAAAGSRWMTFERFGPGGARPVVLDLVVLDDVGAERLRYQLVSPDSDNEVAWDDAPTSRDQRTYRLVRTGPLESSTVSWYEGRPDYERVRLDASRDWSSRTATR